MKEEKEEKSIRDIINEYRAKAMTPEELTLGEASKMMVELSALLGNVNDEILSRQNDFIAKQIEFMSVPKATVAKAKMMSEGSTEWQELQIAKNYKEVVIEMIRALKYRCKALEQEWGVSKNL